MQYTITVSDDQKYIILKVVGDMTSEGALKQNLEAHALGKKLGINRFLVDVTESRNVDSISNNYKFAYQDMRTPAINRSARVAMHVNPNDHSHDFIETLAVNAGHIVKLFTDRELAERYLSG